MRKSAPAYPVFVATKLTTEQAQALKSAARKDDRPVSAYLRRLIEATVDAQGDDQKEEPR